MQDLSESHLCCRLRCHADLLLVRTWCTVKPACVHPPFVSHDRQPDCPAHLCEHHCPRPVESTPQMPHALCGGQCRCSACDDDVVQMLWRSDQRTVAERGQIRHADAVASHIDALFGRACDYRTLVRNQCAEARVQRAGQDPIIWIRKRNVRGAACCQPAPARRPYVPRHTIHPMHIARLTRKIGREQSAPRLERAR